MRLKGNKKLLVSMRRRRQGAKSLVPAKKRSRGHVSRRVNGSGRLGRTRRFGAASKPIAPEPSLSKRNGDAAYELAVRNFELATRHFQRRDYERAREIFMKLAETAPLGVADRAKMHLRLCNQRIAPLPMRLKTAEDYYVAGVSALNARRLDRAVECLAKSAKLKPKREETQYALATAYALQGKTESALEHLKASVRLRPQNLFQARTDEDLQRLASDPRFNHFLGSEPGGMARTGA
jgi:tetratricopeptide (TPR) repeat protein